MDLKTLTEINAPSGHEQPIRRALQATKMLPRAYLNPVEDHPAAKKKRVWVSIVVSVVGIALLAGAIAVFVLVLHGHIEI